MSGFLIFAIGVVELAMVKEVVRYGCVAKEGCERTTSNTKIGYVLIQ